MLATVDIICYDDSYSAGHSVALALQSTDSADWLGDTNSPLSWQVCLSEKKAWPGEAHAGVLPDVSTHPRLRIQAVA